MSSNLRVTCSTLCVAKTRKSRQPKWKDSKETLFWIHCTLLCSMLTLVTRSPGLNSALAPPRYRSPATKIGVNPGMDFLCKIGNPKPQKPQTIKWTFTTSTMMVSSLRRSGYKRKSKSTYSTPSKLTVQLLSSTKQKWLLLASQLMHSLYSTLISLILSHSWSGALDRSL